MQNIKLDHNFCNSQKQYLYLLSAYQKHNIVKKQRSKRFAEESVAVSLDDENNVIELQSDDTVDYEKYIRLLEKKLTPEEKKLYFAKYVQEKKIEEIAKEKDMSVAAVTMRLSRLRRKIKKELDDLII